MGLLQKIEIAQINLLNSLNGLKRLQGRVEQFLKAIILAEILIKQTTS